MTTDTDKTMQLKRALQAIKDLRARLESIENSRREPVAVIGMACRFPGGANTPEAYWDVLKNKVDGIVPVPVDRWNIDLLFDEDTDAPGKVNTRWGGFLPQLDQFDAAFFGISPREAARMDPQQRLMLEVAYEAFEDAGLPMENLGSSRTGVFVGVHSHSSDYYLMQAQDQDDIDIYTGTGTSHSVVSGRISYLYDLQGPNIALDTACSSSLVAVHLATQALRNGECDLAMAGGVNVMLTPEFTIVSSRMRMMAPDGRCKAFDSRADGFVRSEGCGAVILKRLSDALRDGDPILALIRGSAINQDGHSNGLTAPNGISQQAVIRKALENSGVQPEQVSYVETHGTGTPLGDPIEIEALSAVYGQPRSDGIPLVVGSAKSNVGHTEGAAGVAGLIKTVLSLQHQTIPSNLHFEKLNPHISLDGTRLEIAAAERAWDVKEEHRIAAVSAFGWSGTNAHVVLEEAPRSTLAQPSAKAEENAYHLLPISAQTKAGLSTLAGKYAQQLRQEGAPLADICHTAAMRRSHMNERLAVAGCSAPEMAEQLEAYTRQEARPGLASGSRYQGRLPGIVFIFPGQGGQWLGMGRQLIQSEPIFRLAVERCDSAFRPFVDWSLLEQINAGPETSRLEEINVVQPVLFAFQVALAELWRSWGIVPGAVIGHSMGEVAAAHVCGALSLEDAARVICTRSQLMLQVSGKGAMAVVGLPDEQAQARIAAFSGQLSVAVSNSPASSVIAGDPQALQTVMTALTAEHIFCRAVKVDVAAHSPQMEPLRPLLVSALQGITPQTAAIPFYSTVTASRLDGEALDAAYWGRNLRQMVRFGDTTLRALNDGNAIFIEMNPHPILINAVEQTAQAAAVDARLTLVASTRRGEDEMLNLREGLGSLYCVGCAPEWRQVLAPASGQPVQLPNYPWQRETYWLEAASVARTSAGAVPVVEEAHPLLRERVDLPGRSGYFWQKTLKPREFPALFEHRLNGMALLAASASVEMALAAARRAVPDQPWTITDISFLRALALSTDENQPSALLVSLTPAGSGELVFDIFSRQGDQWQAHVSARVQRGNSPAAAPLSLPELQADLQTSAPVEDFYATLKARNVQIGSHLQGITQMWQRDGKILARLTPSTEARFLLAPALLDAGFQLLGSITSGINAEIYMPSKTEQILPGKLDTPPAWVYAALRQPIEADAPIADLQWMDANGVAVLQVNGLHLKPLSVGEHVSENPADWLYTLAWQPLERAETNPPALSGVWLILADQGGWGEAIAGELEQHGARPTLIFAGQIAGKQGQRCVSVPPDRPEELRQVLQQAVSMGDVQGVLHLWSLDMPSTEQLTATSLDAAQALGCGSAVTLIQELAKTNLQTPPRLWLATRSGQSVLPGDTLQPAQAPLWGLGRVIAEEQHEFFGGLVDLPAELSQVAVSALVGAIVSPDEEDQLAWRAKQWYAPRFQRLPAAASTAVQKPLVTNATYLITGGLGGIGLELARWMIQNGANRLVLMGRTALPPRNDWSAQHPQRINAMIQAVLELEALGASVHYASVDVAEEKQLAAFLQAYQSEHWPPIRGVFHAAGVIEDRMVTRLDADALQKVMHPKVVGGWLLHQYLKDQPLDFFVMFSSYGSLVGQAGQGNYAAANAFLDALAYTRQAQGLPAQSINWGAWSGLGFAATPGGKRVLEKLALQGLPAFSAAQGLSALKLLLQQPVAQALVTPVHWGRLQSSGLARARIWHPLLQANQPAAPLSIEKMQTLRESLLALPADQQRPFLQAHIQRTLAQVLRMAPERIEPKTPLGSLGLESMMSVEFRNRLEASLDLKLSATLVWSYPTLYDLTNFLMEKLGISAVEESQVPAQKNIPQPLLDQEEVVQKVKAMSDEDALQALKNRRKGK